MSDLLTSLGSVVTACLGYVGNICTTIVAKQEGEFNEETFYSDVIELNKAI